MSKQKILAVIILFLSVALAVLSYILLPDTVITQITLDADGTSTMPKLFAILLPTALGIGGSIACLLPNSEKRHSQKALIVSVVGVIIFACMIFINLSAQ